MLIDLPSPKLLRKLLRYDPEAGKLFWRSRGPDMFPVERIYKSWNTRYAGMEALCVVDRRGYLYGAIRKKKIFAHRAIWAMANGTWPSGEIDHKNGIPSDNRLVNLRNVSRSENQKNVALKSNNTSGFVGVSLHKASGLWRAEMQSGGKRFCIGYFRSPVDAHRARVNAQNGMGFTERHGKPDCASIKMEEL